MLSRALPVPGSRPMLFRLQWQCNDVAVATYRTNSVAGKAGMSEPGGIWRLPQSARRNAMHMSATLFRIKIDDYRKRSPADLARAGRRFAVWLPLTRRS